MNSKQLAELLNKDFGKDTVLTSTARDVNVVPTGVIALDMALGVGGYPTQRITELYGTESSGKSTLALQAVTNCQATGKIAVYIDAEHALDTEYAANLGVNMEDVILIQPDNAETALNIIIELFTKYSGNLGLVVLDSIAALIPKTEVDSEVGDVIVGLQARLISSFVRRIQPLLTRSDVALILINQQRSTIGGMPGFGGSQKTTTGGMALRYACSIRVELARTGNIDNGKDEVSGIKVIANIKKNKVAPPYRKANYEIYFGKGTPMTWQVVQHAIDLGIAKKSGAWYSYKEIKSQGMNNFVAALASSGAIAELFDGISVSLELPENTINLYKNKLAKEKTDGEISDDN